MQSLIIHLGGQAPDVGELMLASFPTDPLFVEFLIPRNWYKQRRKANCKKPKPQEKNA